jgi:hypothetical protein
MEDTQTPNTLANTTELVGYLTKNQVQLCAASLSTDPFRKLLNFALLQTLRGDCSRDTYLISTDTMRLHGAKLSGGDIDCDDIPGAMIDVANINKMMKVGETLQVTINKNTQRLEGIFCGKKGDARSVPVEFMNPSEAPPAMTYPKFTRVVPEVFPAEHRICVNYKFLNDAARYLDSGTGRTQLLGTGSHQKPIVIIDGGGVIGHINMPLSPLGHSAVNSFAVIMPMSTL